MKLSADTITLLKNFSGINPNIIFKPGQTITTISEAKNIVAVANIQEKIDRQFGIYDLNEFLASVDLIDDAELTFEEKNLIIRGGATSIKYFFAETDQLTAPAKPIKMPDADVVLNISADTISKIKKAAAVLGHPTLSIVGSDGKVTITVLDEKNQTSNRYTIDIDDNNACKEDFSFVLVIGNLKMLPGDYTVEISSKLISKFTNKSLDVSYFIALERTSSFGKK